MTIFERPYGLSDSADTRGVTGPRGSAGDASIGAAFSVSARGAVRRSSRETAAYLHNKTAFAQVIHPDAPPGRHSSRGASELFTTRTEPVPLRRAFALHRLGEGWRAERDRDKRTKSNQSDFFEVVPTSRPDASISARPSGGSGLGDCFIVEQRRLLIVEMREGFNGNGLQAFAAVSLHTARDCRCALNVGISMFELLNRW